jgi:small subunit ribosomal protein S8
MSQIQAIHTLISGIINGQQNHLSNIRVKHSKLSLDILNVLYEEGYILDFKEQINNDKLLIDVKLKYNNNVAAINSIERVAKNTISLKLLDIVDTGLMTYILSTSRGVMSGKEARRLRISGTVLLVIW